MELKAIKTLAAAALLATATTASAGTAPFSIDGASGSDVSLTVQASATAGYDYDFVVSNSSLMGVVTGVYFEATWNSILTSSGQSEGPATLIAGSSSPSIAGWEGTTASHTVATGTTRRLVGRHFRDFEYDNIEGGIQEGDSQTFSFSSDSFSLQDLQALLGTDGYGVAIRAQGLLGDEQASVFGTVGTLDIPEPEIAPFAIVSDEIIEDNEVVNEEDNSNSNGGNNGGSSVEVVSAPSPTAALAGLVVAGIAGLRRRRK